MTTSFFTIIPSHYNSTVTELVKLANQLAMSPEIVKSPFRRSRFSLRAFFNPKLVTRNPQHEPRIRIHPHGLTPEQRLHSLIFFFHCLGLSKRDTPQ